MALAVALLLNLSTTATAAAAESVKLTVGLSPERLGAGTTLEFSARIDAPGGRVPSPLTGLALQYPANLSILASGLGLATCTLPTLEDIGGTGCPKNSQMGYGNALVEIPFGPETIYERGTITIWMGPVQNDHIQLLFYAYAGHPSLAELVFPGTVLETNPPYGGLLDTQIPEIPVLPGGPPASVVTLTAAIGPKNVTYHDYLHGKWVHYKPDGLRLPRICPPGGFPFAATFTFLDNTSTTDRASVPCPQKGPADTTPR